MSKNLSIELQLRADVDKAQKALRQVRSRIGELDDKIDGMGPAMTRFGGGMDTMVTGLLAFNQGLQAADTVLSQLSEIVKVADQYRLLQGRIATTTETQEDAIKVMEDLVAIALRTHAPLEATAELYARLAINTKEAGYSQREMLGFTEAINTALVLNGVKSSEASGALLQLSQAMASGTLRGEEFNSVNEQMPAVIDAVAKHLGKSRAEIKAWAADGEISAEAVMGAVLAMGKTWKEQADQLPSTLGKALTDLDTAWMDYLGTSAQVQTASETIAGAFGLLANNLDGIVSVASDAALAAMPAVFVAAANAAKTWGSTVLAGNAAVKAQAIAVREATAAELENVKAKALSEQASATQARQAQAAAVAQLELAKQTEIAAQKRLANMKALSVTGERRAIAERELTIAIKARTVAEGQLSVASKATTTATEVAATAASRAALAQSNAAAKTGLWSAATGKLKNAVSALANPMNALNVAMGAMITYEIASFLREWAVEAGAAAEKTSFLGKTFDLLATSSEKATVALARVSKEGAEQLAARLKDVSDQTGLNIDSMERFNEMLDRGVLSVNAVTGKLEANAEAAAAMAQETENLKTLLPAATKALERHGKQTAEANKTLLARAELLERQAGLLVDEKAKLEASTDALRARKDAAEQGLAVQRAELGVMEEVLAATEKKAEGDTAAALAAKGRLDALRDGVEAQKQAVAQSGIAVESLEAELSVARLATETYGDQSRQLGVLGAAYRAQTLELERLTATEEAGIVAAGKLTTAKEEMVDAAQRYDVAIRSGSDNLQLFYNESAAAQAAVEDLTKRVDAGKKAADAGKDATEALAAATIRYADALQDGKQRLTNIAADMDRNLGLMSQEADLRQAQLGRLRAEALARGDNDAAMRIEIQALREQVEVEKTVAAAKAERAQAAENLIGFLEKQAEMDNLVTEAERAGIESALDAAAAKRIEAAAAEEAVKAAEGELRAKRAVSQATEEVAEGKSKENEQVREGVALAGQAAAGYSELSDGAQRYLAELKKGADGDYYNHIVTPAAFARVEEAYQSATQHVAGLIEKLQSGTATSLDFAEAARLADDNLLRLAEQDLTPLRAAIGDAASRMEQFQASAQSTLSGLRDELARMEGDLTGIEERDYARRKADLEEQIRAAQEAGDAKALAALRESKRLLEEIHERKMADLEEESNARTANAARAAAEIENVSGAAGGLASNVLDLGERLRQVNSTDLGGVQSALDEMTGKVRALNEALA